MKKILFLLLLLPLFAFTQKDPSFYLIEDIDPSKIDSTELVSLEQALEKYHNETDDTARIIPIQEFVENSWDDNLWPKYNLFMEQYANEQIRKSNSQQKKDFYSKILGHCYSNKGYAYMIVGKADLALEQFQKTITINQHFKDETNLSNTYNNIASVYEMQGKIEMALVYFEKTLELLKKIHATERIGIILNNISSIYIDNEDYDIAIKYLNEAIVYHEKNEDARSLSIAYNNLALTYDKKKEYNKAVDHYNLSLQELKKFSASSHDIATTEYNLAESYSRFGQTDSAFTLINRALKTFERIKYKDGMANCYRSLGNIYFNEKNFNGALQYYKLSYTIAQELGYPRQLSQSSIAMSRIHKAMGNYKEALMMYKLHITMEDSLNNDVTKKAVAKQQAKHEYEKQKALDDAEHEKQLAIEQEAKEKQQIITYATAGGLGLVGIFLVFVFNRLKVTRKQKGIIEEAHHELEEKNTEIMDSIAYAKRIQSAILPPDKLVKEYLEKSFVLYKPKDIVAGDFYWLEHVGDKVLFAAADCTGHGVPGAMVSVVCNNGLNRSVREHGLTDPGKILDKTREIVVQEFEKSEEDVKDGMDIALCSLEGNTLHYAGAHNPLWIIRAGATEIEEIKADKQPIGQTDHPTPYTTHKVELHEGDTFYIFSDGYADQFGGEKGKKLKSANFKKLLLSLTKEDMQSQLALLDDAFEGWKGDLEQLDDVCVIGVRV